MRRVLLALFVLLVAVFVTGCTAPRTVSAGGVAKRHHHAQTLRGLHAVSLEKRADALYDVDDDDDAEIGLLCPDAAAPDDDASPQAANGADALSALSPRSPSAFSFVDDGLGPAFGHTRATEHPPRV